MMKGEGCVWCEEYGASRLQDGPRRPTGQDAPPTHRSTSLPFSTTPEQQFTSAKDCSLQHLPFPSATPGLTPQSKTRRHEEGRGQKSPASLWTRCTHGTHPEGTGHEPQTDTKAMAVVLVEATFSTSAPLPTRRRVPQNKSV